jgi:lambda family phage minor tail protein L
MTTPQAITSEIQKLAPSAVIELFQLDLTVFGDQDYYFHAGTNELKLPIFWQGDEYTPYPMQISGFEFTGGGQLPRPKMVVSNVTGVITALVLLYQDLLGAKITRKRTMAKYLDAVNFDGGLNPNADPTAEFADDIYFIDQKVSENKNFVEFELASSFDVQGVKLPRRQIVQNVCSWKYRGPECGYAGSNYFNINDEVVATLALDACGKRLGSCQLRFGEYGELPFGGFPAAGLVK